jgi:hypothetical protein
MQATGLKHFNQQDLTNLAWSYASLGVLDYELLSKALTDPNRNLHHVFIPRA